MVDVDTIAAIGRPAAPADWLGPKVSGHLALFCIHQVNWLNYRNDSVIMTAS